MPDNEPVIQCLSLTKVFKDFWLRNRVRAVDNLTLDVRRGEVFGLLGPNGSGKSTTIKMILGLLHPTSGRVAVLNKLPSDVKTKAVIGYLPEESYLYPFLNARETLDYYGRLFHLNRDARKRRIDMLLEMVGLEGAQRRPIGEYSKGMQRRIGLAQALINDPQLLILDEPTSGLDPIGTRQIKDLIGELARRGKTILLCSHLLADVEDVCARVAIMFGGKVRAHGSVAQLLVKEGLTTLQTPTLSQEAIQDVRATLARHGAQLQRVEQPRQRLENLFLDIVHQAQTQGAATSGARCGGRIAGFLVSEEVERGAHLPESVAAASVIDALVEKPKPTPAAASVAKTAATPAPSPAEKPTVHEQVIAELAVSPVPTESPAAPLPWPTEDLTVLSNLVPASPGTAPAPGSVPAPVSGTGPGAALTAVAMPSPVPPTPEPPAPDDAKRTSASGEKPYEGFIDALSKVEPWDDSKDAGKAKEPPASAP